MEHEKVRIPAFHIVKVQSQGSIGLVSGNVPYIGFSDGNDTMALYVGQSLPVSAGYVELVNPFSFPADVQITRGAPINIGSSNQWPNRVDMRVSRVSMVMQAVAGRRRGIGFIAKRGAYELVPIVAGGVVDETEIMIIPKASWQFSLIRPAGVFANEKVVQRLDGSINPHVVAISGDYTFEEIDAWKASVGHTQTLIRNYFPPQQKVVYFDDETAVFVSTGSTGVYRAEMQITELGDLKSGERVV